MKNKGKGGKTRRRGKNDTENDKRELNFKDEEQEYAYVTKMLGHGHLQATSISGESLRVHIRGKLRKKVWIAPGNLILVSEREFEKPKEGHDKNVDLILKYNDDEEAQLKKYGEIPDIRVNRDNEGGEGEDEGNIEFNADMDADDNSDLDVQRDYALDDIDIDDL
ncbi:Translation initiation factor 1A [Coemansia sp. Benny D115]|nr:Translation initiation factor 1A [Coemansia sp. Benny D115]